MTSTDQQSPNMLQEALNYAKLGWNVFPVSKNKKPLTPDGFKSATTDQRIIRAWWKLRPTANIGIATGRESNLVVLDIDTDKPEAEDNLRKIVAEHGQFAQTVVARSGGGGIHFYFKHPGENYKVSNAQALFGFKGVDVRGDGGYIIAPPSAHRSGRRYEWGDDQSPFVVALDQCPEFLYMGSPSADDMTFKFTGPIAEGERNATMASIAGLLRSLGMTSDEIYFMLSKQNERRCDPPLSDEEIRTIADSIVKYPPVDTRVSEEAASRVGLINLLGFENSDAGFADMFTFANLGQVRYNHTTGAWLFWNNHFWRPDETQAIVLKAIDTALLYKSATDLIADEDEQVRARRYAISMQSRMKIDAALSIAKAKPQIATTHGDWNKNPDIIAARNGVIDLCTGELKPGNPSDLVSAHIPIDYDIDAKAPRWDKFLNDVFGNNADVIEFVQRAVGYSLTGHITEQCLFMLVGRGSNGKSTLIDTLHSIFGQYSYPAPFDTFIRKANNSGQTNDIAAMAGRRLVTASEPNAGVVLSEGVIKSMTGGEPVSARFLHKEFFTFMPRFKIWLGVNHLPRVIDDSDGFWRRVRRVNFDVQFVAPEDAVEGSLIRDPYLSKKLVEEHPGILRWAVEGAIKWARDGLKVPKTVTDATRTYRVDSDPLHSFFDSSCDQGNKHQVLADVLYRAYTAYCQARLMKAYEILSHSRFHERMARQFERTTLAGQTVYVGIDLNVEGKKLSAQSDSTPIVIRRVQRS